MRKMGGLRKYMPQTRWTMLVATLAIAGMPLFAGFYSKDEILAGAFAFHPGIWFLGAAGAGLTAFYMFRLYFMTFSGHYRGAGGGFPTPFQRWLKPVLLPVGGRQFHFHEASHAQELILMAASVGIAAVGIFLAFRFYKRDEMWAVPKRLATRLRPIYGLLTNKY